MIYLCQYKYNLKLKTFDLNTKYFPYLGIFKKDRLKIPRYGKYVVF